MSNEILVALIALIGVLVSVAISLFSSMRLTNTELQKLRQEIQKTYSGKLLDKRLEVYPDLYYLLSDFAKKALFGTVVKRDLEKLLDQTNKWNSRHSILFSGQTNKVSYHFRKTLTELAQQGADSPEALHSFIDMLSEFELALKSDLGIYVVEFADTTKRFSSYTDLSEAVKQFTNRTRKQS